MFKIFILLTGVLSFLHFAFPKVLANSIPKGDVLGINKIESLANYQTVRTALEIYCLNKNSLPNDLNDLYGSELSQKREINLNLYFRLEKQEACNFKLIVKT